GLKPDERDGGILAPTGKTETGYGEYRLHNIALFGQQLLAHGVHGLLGTLHGRARRPQHLDEHDALVLVGQEGTGQLAEQHDHRADNHGIQQQVGYLAAQYGNHALLIAIDATFKGTVEPAEEAPLRVALALGNGLEDGGTERRREDQRHQHRQGHGRSDGDGELAIDDPRAAPEDRHGHKHRRQHQADTDQRTLDLVHRLAGGLHRRQALLGHHPFDVLHHHDGVVHQQTDSQHHGEHGQDIDAEAERREHTEGSQQNHRHCQGRDQGGAEVLQEQIHHQEYQHDGFHQCMHYPSDGFGDHRGRLEGI